ncbi:hypothetical protein HGRIS_001323 [Hohenbuehelia grisea]|uniref:Uncharacterized protein n=1 Tax=Hohenbuehelia grisea TaxID=104357 RepID=A0ABR3JQH9_9AGAR
MPSLHTDLEAAKVAQCDVQHGAVLGGVDVLTGKHLVAEGLDISLFGEIEEGFEDLGCYQVLGEVKEKGG